MPIYEFHCGHCSRDSEVLVRSSKWDGMPCHHCGKDSLEKKLSVFASASSAAEMPPACSGNPTSCGRCGPE